MRTGVRHAHSLTIAVAFALAAAAGCKKDVPADLAAEPAASAEPAAAPGGSGQAEYDETTFHVVMKPASEFVAGKPGVLEIQLAAKGGFHMNDTYPYRFKTAATDGVKFGAPVYEKDAMQMEPAKGTMKLEVTPESAGAKSVRGVFHFSVCSADRCLVEKRTLAVSLPVN
jgi:hypothetical protein